MILLVDVYNYYNLCYLYINSLLLSKILECGGNLFDVCSIGVKSALYTTRTPHIYLTGEDGGEIEFSVSDNSKEIDRFDVTYAPILITHLRVRRIYFNFYFFSFLGCLFELPAKIL